MSNRYNRFLGICIPTYKRPEQLVASVKTMIRAARPHNVPIFIIDDSADDTNVQALAELRSLYRFVYHTRNEANLGIDRNILKAVDTCDCHYAWVMGEDDRMTRHAVTAMLDVLEQAPGEIAFAYANYASIDEDVSIILKERSLPLTHATIESAEQFFRRHAWSMGFIGACVVHKGLWGAVRQEPYLDTYFAHVGVIMESLHGKDVYLVAEPLVLNRCGTARTFTWIDQTFDVLSGWSRLMESLQPLYGEDACRESLASFEAAHGLNSLRFLCYTRADGAFTPDVYRRRIAGGDRGKAYRGAAALVSVTPTVLFRVIRWGIQSARKLRATRLREDELV